MYVNGTSPYPDIINVICMVTYGAHAERQHGRQTPPRVPTVTPRAIASVICYDSCPIPLQSMMSR